MRRGNKYRWRMLDKRDPGLGWTLRISKTQYYELLRGGTKYPDDGCYLILFLITEKPPGHDTRVNLIGEWRCNSPKETTTMCKQMRNNFHSVLMEVKL